LLVNNAGMGVEGPVGAVDAEKLDAMIALNVTALTRLARAAIPGFIARGRGTIVNVGSVLALAPEQFNACYAGTKAYVLAFSQALHHELGKHGIRVQAVLPGATRTEIWERSGLDLSRLPPSIVMEPEELVDAALAGLDQGERVTIPSLPDLADWDAFLAARNRLGPNLSRDHAAPRYGTGAREVV
jgi:short-subunit dehydrogenase